MTLWAHSTVAGALLGWGGGGALLGCETCCDGDSLLDVHTFKIWMAYI